MTKLLRIAGVLALSLGSVKAATTTIDFNSDPSVTEPDLFTEGATDTNAEWRPDGGASGQAGDGYLSLTDATDSQKALLIFKDLENGLVVKSFTFECDLRIGGGTTPPADGFSINYCNVDDPVISSGTFGGTTSEANLPEEGTQTGLAIGFDTWQSGVDVNGTVQDVVGLSIRVDGKLLAQLPVPMRPGNIYLPTMPLPGQQGTQYEYNSTPYVNLATNDPNYNLSMQTGAQSDVDGDGDVDADDAGAKQPSYWNNPEEWAKWVKNLKWEHFKAELDDAGNVKVFWKGQEVTPAGGIATGFAPRAGRIVLGARTGASWEVTQLDNLKLTTVPFTSPFISGFRANAGGFTAEISDVGTTVLDASSLAVQLNGTTVIPSLVTKMGTTNFVRYTVPTPLAVGSTNNVHITFKDNFDVESSADRSFIVGSFTTVPAEYAATGVDTSGSGFDVRVNQMDHGRTFGDGTSTANAERQLAGRYIDPNTGQPYPNLVPPGPDNGTYPVTVINWNQYPAAAGATSDIGNFQDNGVGTQQVADEPIPGIEPGPNNSDPAFPPYNDNIVAEATAYLDLPAGFYTFGVNSDDGFKVSTARSAKNVLGLTLGEFNGGRGSSDTLFDVYIPTDGIYPIRLLWWEGGSDANCEFFVVNQTTGEKILVNDRNAEFVVKSYPTATSRVPYVSRAIPENNQLFVFADQDVVAEITDGSAATVNASSVSLTVNGTPVSTTATKSGDVTTIKRAGSVSNLLNPENNTASVAFSYSDGGNTVNVTNNWSFTVVPYAIIPAANKVDDANINKNDGVYFKAIVNQIDRTGDQNQVGGGRLPVGAALDHMPRPEMQLHGGDIDARTGEPYPNLASPAGMNENGVYDLYWPLNLNSPMADSGIFVGDIDLPGLPGTGSSPAENPGYDNYVAEFRTYLDLKKGAYIWAVNSDDGFVASSGTDTRDTLGTLLGFANLGRGNAATLPAPGGISSYIPTPGTDQNNFAFGVVVPEDGIYPVRILYWQGGGGANIEFLSLDRNSGRRSLIGDYGDPLSIPAYGTYTGPERPYVKFSISPTPWDNRIMQGGPGLIKAYGHTVTSADGGGIVNDSDTRRPWANVGIGGVIANGVGNTLGLELNGNPVDATYTTNGTDVTVVYRPDPALPSGSTNTASLIYGGVTNSWTFIVQTYTNLNASDALPLTAADSSARGFRVKIAQIASNPSDVPANTTAWAEALIAGNLGTDISVPGTSDNGSYIYPNIINWSEKRNLGHSGAEYGNFQENVYGSGWPYPDYPDEPLPGLPGTGVNNNSTDYSAAEIFAYLAFPKAGYYRFGVNSDDGFGMKVGTPGETNGPVVFSVDVGKGSSDIPFSFTVPEAGLYPIRLVYYNGTGDANLEYFTYDDNGNKIPVNDTNNPAAIKAYYNVEGGGPVEGPEIETASVAGGQITITWTGGGTLESSPTLGAGAVWTSTGNNSGSFTEAATGTAKFYRVKQ